LRKGNFCCFAYDPGKKLPERVLKNQSLAPKSTAWFKGFNSWHDRNSQMEYTIEFWGIAVARILG